MTQKAFDFHFKCSDLETRNAELEAENQALKEKVSDLAFEVVLLKDLCDYEEEDKKEAIIERQEKLLAEKDAEIARLQRALADSTAVLDLSLMDVFNDPETPSEKTGEDAGYNPSDKMGEDTGEEPPNKKRKHYPQGPRVYKDDGTYSRKMTGARAYNSRRTRVTDPRVLSALNSIM